MKRNSSVLLVLVLLLAAAACRQKQRPMGTDTQISGSIKIAVDESFEPIVDEEAFVFKAIYTDAKPVLQYDNENNVLRSLLSDSLRLAIMSRELDSNEIKLLKGHLLVPETTTFAIDAVVLIVNKMSNDTTITVDQIKNMLNGKTKQDANIVFDNPNSSLVRYLKDISGNRDLKQKNIYALRSNKEVINYVSQHQNSIGIVGFSWLADPDKDYAQAVDNVKVVAVKDEHNKKAPNQYFKPSQTTLALKQYPLSRRLYIINCSGRLDGLAAGFSSFLLSQRGQRIVLKSGLLPDSIPEREINVIHKLSIK